MTWIAAGLAATVLIVAIVRERNLSSVPAQIDSAERVEPQTVVDSDELIGSRENSPTPTPTPPSPEPVQAGTTDTTSGEGEDGGSLDKLPSAVAAAARNRPPVVAGKPAESLASDQRRAIESRLDQTIVLFEQSTPIAFDVLRLQLEELADVSIDYEDTMGSSPPQSRTPVSVALEDVTLGSILDEVARQAGLSYIVDPSGIRLVPSSTAVEKPDPPIIPKSEMR